jgi:phosphotransferase system enzyme I (PtsI)
MSLLLTGIGVSQGIAIGKVHVLQRGEPEILEYAIPSHLIESEIQRFRQALTQAKEQLRNIRHAIPANAPADVADFIDAHLLMLDDGLLSNVPEILIRSRQCNAEWALKLQRDELVAVFDQMQDPYLRTRRNDIDHVIHRVQRILLNQDLQLCLNTKIKNQLIVADDLTPADILVLQHQGIAGFITEFGGPLSHTAILARGLAIPAVVGIHEATDMLHNEEKIILDGDKGMVIADVDDKTLKTYRQHQRDYRNYLKHLTSLRHTPAETLDGQSIHLQANIEVKEDIRALKQVGAEGVGLYRTEFLFLDRTQAADEEEQLQNYRSVIRALKGKPLTIRTLDLGADKECPNGYSNATNPALGLRAIRRSLKDIDTFKEQLRAILRASAYGPVRIMFPMLTAHQELRQAMVLLEVAKDELRKQKRRFDEDMPVGAMIEVPAAALSADSFAKDVDFLSIGTNDLIQYTLAIDRVDGEVNYLYDPLHPAVLKLIEMTLKAGRRAKIKVSMCGEMAGDVRYTRLLLGMGLREFSTPPSTLLEVKKAINASSIGSLKKQCKHILGCQDPEKISTLVNELNL